MNRSTAGGLTASLSIALLGVVAPAAAAQAAPALSVSVVTANGSGCPSSSATAQAVDSDTFTVRTDPYYAWSGDSAPTTDFRKNCLVALSISQPAGWTFAVTGADFDGYALIGDGLTGTQAATYYFQAQAEQQSGSHTIDGPHTGSWSTSDSFSDLIYAPCDAPRNLNINTSVRVSPSTDGLNWIWQDPTFTVHLAWKAC